MATIQERKTKDGKVTYRVLVRLKGHSHQQATFNRITDARRWAHQTESAIQEGRHFKTSESKKHTLGKLIDRYIEDVIPLKKKNGAKQKAQLLWWKEQIGNRVLADVTPSLIGEYRDILLKGITYRGTKRSPATAVRYLAALSHALSTACKEWGWLEDSPMRKVSKPKEPRGRVRYLETEERERLLQACRESKNQYLYTIVVVALSTGMRRSEILNLLWRDVDLDKGRITLHETKNGERRVVPLVGYALELLRQHGSTRRIDTVLVFPAFRGQKPQKSANFRGAWETALKQAGIEDFRFHDLRHCCASYLVMGGASLAEAGELLGHKSLQVTRRYSHLSEVHTAGVVEKMNDKIFGGVG